MKLSNLLQSSKQENNNGEKDANINWSALKDEDHSDSFFKTEIWLRNISGSLHTKKPKSKVEIMKQYIISNKVKIAVVFIFALFVAACNLPVTQNETVGHIISWSVQDPKGMEKIESLPWVDKNSLSVNEDESNGVVTTSYNLVLPNSTLEEVQAYSKELGAIPEVVSVNIMPLTEEVERPLYSKMLDDVFKIDINAKNMSDEELSAEVERQLRENGIEATTVNFRRDENNRRKIDITVSPDLKKDQGFQLNIDDGDQKMHIQEMRKFGDGKTEGFDFKGKSDQEIKDMIKERFKEQNLQDSDIIVKRDGEKTTVEIAKENSNGNKKQETNMKIELAK